MKEIFNCLLGWLSKSHPLANQQHPFSARDQFKHKTLYIGLELFRILSNPRNHPQIDLLIHANPSKLVSNYEFTIVSDEL